MDATLRKILKDIRPQMKCERYEHTYGVMYIASALAMRYEYDPKKAMLAGALHDCAKIYTCKDYVKECERCGISVKENELKLPHLLHAPLGAYYAKVKYGIEDVDIINAVRYHTLGRFDMGLLEKIVYVADYIEPSRKGIENLAEIRALAFTDLDCAILFKLENVVNYLKKNDYPIDDATIELLEYYRENFGSNKG